MTSGALDDAIAALGDAALLGVDTEFMRTRTYWAQLCLLQISARGSAFVIDTMADIRLDNLWPHLEAGPATKIMHAPGQDLEIFYAMGRNRITPVFDTQIACGLIGLPPQIGYAAAVEQLLGVAIEKSETRTDWSRRPLSAAQLHYAAEDVVHLPPLFRALSEKLESLDRMDWAIEDSERAADPDRFRVDPEVAWQRVKGIGRLPPREAARAMKLAAWRETTALRADRPRLWIMKDDQLLAVAAAGPRKREDIAAIDSLPRGLVRRQADRLVATVQSADREFEAGSLKPPRQRARDASRQSLIRDMKAIVAKVASDLGIAAEVLASRRDIAGLIDRDEDCRLLTGWRRERVGEELEDLLKTQS